MTDIKSDLKEIFVNAHQNGSEVLTDSEVFSKLHEGRSGQVHEYDIQTALQALINDHTIYVGYAIVDESGTVQSLASSLADIEERFTVNGKKPRISAPHVVTPESMKSIVDTSNTVLVETAYSINPHFD